MINTKNACESVAVLAHAMQPLTSLTSMKCKMGTAAEVLRDQEEKQGGHLGSSIHKTLLLLDSVVEDLGQWLDAARTIAFKGKGKGEACKTKRDLATSSGKADKSKARHYKADKGNEVAEAEASDDHEVAWNCNRLIRQTMAEEYKTKMRNTKNTC